MAQSISQKISLLNQVTLESLNEEDKPVIVKKFTEAGLQILNADFGWAWWRRSTAEKYQLAYKSANIPYEPNPPRKRGGNWQAQKTGTPVFVSDAGKQTYSKDYDVRPYMKSYVIIPIMYEQQSWGNVVLCFKQRKRFSSEDVSLCAALGSSMAQALTINRLHHNLRNIKHTLDHTPEPVLMFDPQTSNISYFNQSLLRHLGRSARQMAGGTVAGIIHPSFQKIFNERLKHILARRVPSSMFEVMLAGSGNRKVPAEISLQYVTFPGQSPHFLTIIRDLRERKKSQELIRRAAFHDALTGLPNRFLFTQRLATLLKESNQKNRRFAVIFIDLDRFKFINDILGHLLGDRLLQQVGRRLRRSVKRSDIVSRLGGDEFVILLANLKSGRQADQIARRIRKEFQAPFKLLEQEIYVSFSMGISTFPKDGTDGESLLKNADNALYRAKQQGGNTYQHYHSDIVIPHASRLEMEKELRNAIARNELRLHYQPIVDLASGRVISVEALVRWQHPKMGLISPADFIPQAEESGLIVQLGEWVFAQSSRQLKEWRREKLNVSMSINMSARELLQNNMLKKMQKTLRSMQLSPKDIALELTETFLVKNMKSSVEVLEQFRKLGFKTVIDDFGTGYASLSYLKRLPIDYIKIDQLFVKGCVTNKQDAGIIEAIITVAHHLGIKVVAEGVEQRSQAAFLQSLGCDMVQGNFYSKPLPAEDAIKLLKKRYKLAKVA